MHPGGTVSFSNEKRKKIGVHTLGFSMVGVTVNPESIENQRVRISHYLMSYFDLMATRTRPSK